MIVLELSLRDLSRIKYVDLLVSKFYRISLYEFCKRYNYDSLFVEVIKQVTNDYGYDKLSYFEVELPDTFDDRYYEIEKKFSYGVDNRSVCERIISLGVNWVVEDVIVHKSSSVFILTGCDNARDFLANPITNTPDIRYVGKGESFYVEVCSDFTNFMKKNRRYDLRKLKYCKLEDLWLIEKKKTALLFVDVVNKTYCRSWFISQSYGNHDKYLKNTVAFEFSPTVEFQGLEKLFESCKNCQVNPSLYSNFNIEVKEEKKVSKCLSEQEDEGYWESLYQSEPAFIRSRVPDIDEFGNERESGLKDTYNGYQEDMGLISKENMGFDTCDDMGFTELPEDTWTPFDEQDRLDSLDGLEPPFDLDGPFGDNDSPF